MSKTRRNWNVVEHFLSPEYKNQRRLEQKLENEAKIVAQDLRRKNPSIQFFVSSLNAACPNLPSHILHFPNAADLV